METAESISSQIRRYRTARGLSLGQLARRTDTSAAALSRYEHGWERFEIQTLRKLAAALDCRLVVRLEPVSTSSAKPARAHVVRALKRLFWDHDLTGADLDRYPVWVVERVIEYGSLADVRLLMAWMGRAGFLRCVAEARFSSPRTAAFWQAILKREGTSCTRKWSRGRPGRSWPTWAR